MYLDKAKALLAESDYVNRNHIRPCTEEEVVAYEEFLGMRLPAAYREFLLWGGHRLGDVRLLADFYYQNLFPVDQRRKAQELLESYREYTDINIDDVQIDEGTIIIGVYYYGNCTTVAYCRVAEGDDPPVYSFGEWHDEGYTHKQVAEKYSDYLYNLVLETKQYVTRLSIGQATDFDDLRIPDERVESLLFYNGFRDEEALWRNLPRFQNLRELQLSFWRLKQVSPVIGQLSQLRYLNLNANHLKELPIEVTNLKTLEELGLTWNKLTTFIEILRRLPKLKSCSLKHNPLTVEEIVQIQKEFPFVYFGKIQ